MIECVKCGHREISHVDNCAKCTWPYTFFGWSKTTFSIRAITIDTNCINAKQKIAEMNQLELWSRERKFLIQRADILLDEVGTNIDRIEKLSCFLPQPKLFTLNESMLDGEDVLAGPDLGNELRVILFPTTKLLTRNQENDVEHLRSHIRVGGDIFITLNSKYFIANERKEKLQKRGIWVFTPKEAVDFLRTLYKWS